MNRAFSWFVLLTCSSAWVHADELWRQASDGQSSHGPCWRWPATSADKMLADDFDVVGRIEQVRVGGGTYSVDNLVLEGVYVRFFEYGANDAPGALQAEYFVPVGGNLEYETIDQTGTLWFVATIDPPFQTTGRHFVSVQPLMDREWFVASSGTGTPRGQAIYFRSSPTQPWQYGDQTPFNDDNCDLNVTLYGTLTGAPRIDALGAGTLPRSGRLTIHGANFSNEQGAGFVLIDGIRAPTTTWTDDRIVAYIPEQAALGAAAVQVVTAAGSSNAVTINVTARQRDGRVLWTFDADGSNLWYRPALAPDGTIYLHGSGGFVYALAPDGGLRWTNKVNWYPYVPPTAGPDGTLYVGSILSVFAITPDGEIAWEFVDSNAQAIQVAPTIGPDGNLFGAYDPANPGLGAFSLTPDGAYRWSSFGTPEMFSYGDIGTEMRFGPSQAGGPVDQLYFGMDLRFDPYLYAFSLDGQQRWAIQVGPNAAGAQPAIGSDGTVYSTDFIASGFGWVIRAFEPGSGGPLWLYDGDFISGVSHLEIDLNDNLYYVADLAYLESLDPRTQALRWSRNTGDVLDAPSVSPDGMVVVASGVPNFGEPGFIKGFDATNGQELWTVPLPGTFYPAPRLIGTHRPRFSADSHVAYVSTSMLAADESDPYATLFAIALTNAGDVDGDGDVDLADLAMLLSAFGTCSGDAQFNAAADFDQNGCVELSDLATLLSGYGA